MFEKFFGKKKIKYNEDVAIPGEEKISKLESAHADVDGVLISGEVLNDSEADLIQDIFQDNKVSERSFHAGKRIIEDLGKGYYVADERSAQKTRTKYENDQKPIRKDKNKDWKEKEPFALDLSEGDNEEKHLNANADIADVEDDSDLERAA